MAQEGRNVICTIHQPSALIFEKFDKLYALAEGYCIYNGPSNKLLPHYSQFGLECPPYHNPADFCKWLLFFLWKFEWNFFIYFAVIEVASSEYDIDLEPLIKSSVVLNGKLDNYDFLK